MITYPAPGVYRQDIFPAPAPIFLTGTPVFLGYTPAGKPKPEKITLWPEFEAKFGPPLANGYLAHAVRGFFENDGLMCYVLPLMDDGVTSPLKALQAGLAAVSDLDDVDLVCAPDIMRTVRQTVAPTVAKVTPMQMEVLAHCQRLGDRFAILDGMPHPDTKYVKQQRAALTGDYGALYYPWLWVPGTGGQKRYVPPCGHVAGIYSRSDQRVGVHKAPANEALDGVFDLRANLNTQTVGELYRKNINCLCAFPGRGFRVWGARTLSADPAWLYVNARRIFLTVTRWIERFMADLVYEPNDIRLWVRIMRELTAYLEVLFRRGGLKGRTPEEAFFVKCDSETNPPDVIDAGTVVTEIGVALAAPAEFIVVRIIHGASGVAVTAGA